MLNLRRRVREMIVLPGRRALIGGIALLLLAGPVLAWPPGGNGGGKPPKDPPADLIPLKIILLGGQSNMTGFAEVANLPSEWLDPQPDVLIYRANIEGSANGLWRDLQPGFGRGTNPGDYLGPELSFGRAMADARADDNIALIKPWTNGNSLALDFDPVAPGASWVLFVDTVYNALADIDPDVYAPEIVGMIWSQGGKDAQTEEQALAYETNLTNFIWAVRAEFGNPSLPFIIRHLHRIEQRNFGQEVYDAQTNVWLNTPNTGLFESDDLLTVSETSGHFNAAGQLELGMRFASELLAIPVLVYSVDYALGGRRNRDLTVTITVVDEMGPVSGASVSATLDHESGDFWDASGTTDSDGMITFPLKNAPDGCYTTTVVDVNAGILNWDGFTPVNQFCK